jgi:hypothetical protein
MMQKMFPEHFGEIAHIVAVRLNNHLPFTAPAANEATTTSGLCALPPQWTRREKIKFIYHIPNNSKLQR